MPKLLLTPKTHHVVLEAQEAFYPATYKLSGHMGNSVIDVTLNEKEIRKLRIWLTDLEVKLARKRRKK